MSDAAEMIMNKSLLRPAGLSPGLSVGGGGSRVKTAKGWPRAESSEGRRRH